MGLKLRLEQVASPFVCVCVLGSRLSSLMVAQLSSTSFASRLGWVGRKLDTESITAQAATKCLDGISFDVMALHRLVQSADLAPGLWQKPLRKDAEVQTGPVESMVSHEQLRETIEATAKATEHEVRQIYVEQLQTTKVKMEKNFEVKLADVKKHYEIEIQNLRTKLEDKQLHKENGILRKHMQDYDTKLMDLRSKIKEMTGEKQKLEQ